MNIPEPIQHTVRESFSFLHNLALPIFIGVSVAVVSGLILYLVKRQLRK